MRYSSENIVENNNFRPQDYKSSGAGATNVGVNAEGLTTYTYDNAFTIAAKRDESRITLSEEQKQHLSEKLLTTAISSISNLAWYESVWYGVGSFFNNAEFVSEGSFNASVGLQIGGKVNAWGVVHLEGNLAAVKADLVDYNIAFTNLDSPEGRSFYHAWDGSGVRMTSEVTLTAGLMSSDVVAITAYQKFKTHGTGSFGIERDAYADLIIPFTKNKRKKGPFTDMIKKPDLDNPKLTIDDKEFYGIDIGAGAALIIGIEFDFKIGLKW